MFDMSEFYRDTARLKTEPLKTHYSRHHDMNTETDMNGDCTDPLTMVFINAQPLENVYPLNEAFCNGTLFPNLNKPFGGMQV